MEKVFIISTVATLGVTGVASLVNVLMPMLAQHAPSEIVGTTGWVGAGLLGLVLAWLLGIHLPAKDKQLKEFNDSKDLLVKALNETKDMLVREILQQGKLTLEMKDKAYETLLVVKDKQIEAKDAQLERSRHEYTLSLKLIADELRGVVKDTTTLSTNIRKARQLSHQESGGRHDESPSG